MVTETDLELGDGRTLHAYDTVADDAEGRLAVFWHHGSPNIGAPPEPLFSAADRLGLRVELRPLGKTSSGRVEEPKQLARREVVDVRPSLGGHHAALASPAQLTPISG